MTVQRRAQTLVLFGLILCVLTTVMARRSSARADSCLAASCRIEHVVIVVKENRTFDNYFGTYPGADGTRQYRGPDGRLHPLTHQPDRLWFGLGHSAQAARLAFDGGKMDGFSSIPGAIQFGKDYADSQLYQSDIPNYWSYAQHFTLDDHLFSPVMGPSFPNHLFTITANANALGNPWPADDFLGCDKSSRGQVDTVNSQGEHAAVNPCFNYKTMADLLDVAHLDWRYYGRPTQLSSEAGYLWSAFGSIKHIRFGPDWQTHVVDYRRFDTDVRTGNLPPVSWLIQPAEYSDHPPYSVCEGENWTVKRLDGVMRNAQLWQHTAVIVLWDDFGGFYDHLTPPAGVNPFLGDGFRVPGLVISPYARRGFVDSTHYDFISVLRFVESVFGLPAMGSRDTRAADMTNSFNFRQAPLPPLILRPRTCPDSAHFDTLNLPPSTLTRWTTSAAGSQLSLRYSDGSVSSFSALSNARIVGADRNTISTTELRAGDNLLVSVVGRAGEGRNFRVSDIVDRDVRSNITVTGIVARCSVDNGAVIVHVSGPSEWRGVVTSLSGGPGKGCRATQVGDVVRVGGTFNSRFNRYLHSSITSDLGPSIVIFPVPKKVRAGDEMSVSLRATAPVAMMRVMVQSARSRSAWQTIRGLGAVSTLTNYVPLTTRAGSRLSISVVSTALGVELHARVDFQVMAATLHIGFGTPTVRAGRMQLVRITTAKLSPLLLQVQWPNSDIDLEQVSTDAQGVATVRLLAPKRIHHRGRAYVEASLPSAQPPIRVHAAFTVTPLSGS